MSGRRVSRRHLLGVAAVGAAAGLTGLGAASAGTRDRTTAGTTPDATVEFHGEHQAGITTPQQARVHVTAFDVVATSARDIAEMLQSWTDAARKLTSGQPVGVSGAVDGSPEAPPDDTGEALGLPPAALTLTIGFGASLFDERFGLGLRRPPALVDLPRFAGDELDPAISNGDIVIQACADDSQVALHAVRQLTRLGAGVVYPRWAQMGFAPTAVVAADGATPRNLQGFKDGTHNLDTVDAQLTADQLWAPADDGAAWMAGGTYLVSRRIRMHIETWDRVSLREQEQTIGRYKGSGAPLGEQVEHDEPDFRAIGADGQPVIPATAHVRMAHPDHNDGAHLLRRGYSFHDGVDRLGLMDAGLFFLAFQRDPRRQFIPIMERMSGSDALNEYVRHESSAVWACPPGVTPTGFWGDTLFA